MLGNKKSSVVVAAVNEYLLSHPNLQDTRGKIEVNLTCGYSRDKIEEIIRAVVAEHLASFRMTGPSEEIQQDDQTEVLEADIAQMLDNLDMFS